MQREFLSVCRDGILYALFAAEGKGEQGAGLCAAGGKEVLRLLGCGGLCGGFLCGGSDERAACTLRYSRSWNRSRSDRRPSKALRVRWTLYGIGFFHHNSSDRLFEATLDDCLTVFDHLSAAGKDTIDAERLPEKDDIRVCALGDTALLRFHP